MPVYALALVAQAAQPEAGAGELSSRTDFVRLLADAGPHHEGRSADPAAVLGGLLGHHPLQDLGITGAPSSRPPDSLTCSARAASSPKSRPCARRSAQSPLVGLFQSGYAEFNAQLRAGRTRRAQAGGAAAVQH